MSVVPGDSRTYGLAVIDPFLGVGHVSEEGDIMDYGTRWPHMCDESMPCRVIGYKRGGARASMACSPTTRVNSVGVIAPNDPWLPRYMGAVLRGIDLERLGAIRPYAGLPFFFDMFGRPRLGAAVAVSNAMTSYYSRHEHPSLQLPDLTEYMSNDTVTVVLEYLPAHECSAFTMCAEARRVHRELPAHERSWYRAWGDLCSLVALDALQDAPRYLGNKMLHALLAKRGYNPANALSVGATAMALAEYKLSGTAFSIEYHPQFLERELYQVRCCEAHGGNCMSMTLGTLDTGGTRIFSISDLHILPDVEASRVSTEYGMCMPPGIVHATLKGHRFKPAKYGRGGLYKLGSVVYSREVLVTDCARLDFHVTVVTRCGGAMHRVFGVASTGWTVATETGDGFSAALRTSRSTWIPARFEPSVGYMLGEWRKAASPFVREDGDPFIDGPGAEYYWRNPAQCDFEGTLLPLKLVEQHMDGSPETTFARRIC